MKTGSHVAAGTVGRLMPGIVAACDWNSVLTYDAAPRALNSWRFLAQVRLLKNDDEVAASGATFGQVPVRPVRQSRP